VKILLLIIVVFFYVQPDTAAACDLVGDPPAQQHMDHGKDHDVEPNHDCCAKAPPDPKPGCDHGMDCGTCTAGVLALAYSTAAGIAMAPAQTNPGSGHPVLPSRSFPLFKPPIS
jgi:hypothetical protein